MISLLSVIVMGFLLGMRHATDPDHVIAVSTIVSHEGNTKRASMIGVAWGIGHTLTIVAVGFLMIFFRIALPPRVGLAMELAVGLMLIFLGLNNLRGFFHWAAERFQVGAPDHGDLVPYHPHGDFVDAHIHGDQAVHGHDNQHNMVAAMDRWFPTSGLYHLLRPLIIGIVHGLAGSAAIALLVLTTIGSVSWAVGYLVVFGIGTVLGMMLITLTMGSTFTYAKKRLVSAGRSFGWVAGAISVAFGLFITYQIGFVDGLFRAQAHWIPR
jgi:ABC-type nickel/cobalt efflux system permease component RcnA